MSEMLCLKLWDIVEYRRGREAPRGWASFEKGSTNSGLLMASSGRCWSRLNELQSKASGTVLAGRAKDMRVAGRLKEEASRFEGLS
jgi:hypothetical protein